MTETLLCSTLARPLHHLARAPSLCHQPSADTSMRLHHTRNKTFGTLRWVLRDKSWGIVKLPTN